MGLWLSELRRNLPPDIVLHVVGTKADMVAREPRSRQVPFERCIAYVAENLAPGMGSTPPPTATPLGMPGYIPLDGAASAGTTYGGSSTSAAPALPGSTSAEPRSPSSKRSSGFWGQEAGWDACHEISAETGEGVEEVFRVVSRKLVEQNRKMQAALLAATSTPGDGMVTGVEGSAFDGAGGPGAGMTGYFDGANARGSFRVGRDRRSWLFSPGFAPPINVEPPGGRPSSTAVENRRSKRRCC